MDKCNKIELRNEPLIHSQLIFTNVQTQLKREGFFFFKQVVLVQLGTHIQNKTKRTLIQFLNLHHMQKITQNVLYRHIRHRCKTCL